MPDINDPSSLRERVRRLIGVDTLGPLTDQELSLVAQTPPEYARAFWESIVRAKYCSGIPESYGPERDRWIRENHFCEIAPVAVPQVAFARRAGEGILVSVTAMLLVWLLTKDIK